MNDERDTPKLDPDQPLKIDVDPEDALRGLLKVDPNEPIEQDQPLKDQGDGLGMASSNRGRASESPGDE
jgi:hypothetical protein